MILLDTSILSLALRRSSPGVREASIVATLERMIREDAPLRVPGVVAQELLSGIKTEQQFSLVHARLAGFRWILALESDHVLAGRIYNSCARKGVSAGIVDCLIVALALEQDAQLWAEDQDFLAISNCCELNLFRPQ